MTTLYVRSSPPPPPVYPDHVLQLHGGPEPATGYTLYATMGARPMAQLQLKSWSWIPRQLLSASAVRKEPGRLAAVVAFARPDGTRFTVLLGSVTDLGDVGVVILDGYEERGFGDWEVLFQSHGLQPSHEETVVQWERHSVRVNIDERVVQNTKYFVVSVNVEEHRARAGWLFGGLMNEARYRGAPHTGSLAERPRNKR